LFEAAEAFTEFGEDAPPIMGGGEIRIAPADGVDPNDFVVAGELVEDMIATGAVLVPFLGEVNDGFVFTAIP
jgi:hypothetical protein